MDICLKYNQILLLLTGNVPGSEASNSETCELIGAANSVADPENSFDLEAICAWISKPITASHETSGSQLWEQFTPSKFIQNFVNKRAEYW